MGEDGRMGIYTSKMGKEEGARGVLTKKVGIILWQLQSGGIRVREGTLRVSISVCPFNKASKM